MPASAAQALRNLVSVEGVRENPLVGYGLVVELVHSGGVVTRYAHCRSALVKPGERVTMGQAIATVGSSGLATAPHLHFEVLLRGSPVDPVKFLAGTRAPAAPTTSQSATTSPEGNEE